MITLQLPAKEHAILKKKSSKIGLSVEDYIISQILRDTSPKKVEKEKKRVRKLGFMRGEITVPDDIHWGDKEILSDFGE